MPDPETKRVCRGCGVEEDPETALLEIDTFVDEIGIAYTDLYCPECHAGEVRWLWRALKLLGLVHVTCVLFYYCWTT